MTEDLKKLILKAAEILQSFGADEVFFFGSMTRATSVESAVVELAVTGLPEDAFFPAMGAMMSIVKRPCNLVDLDEDNPYVSYLKSHGKLQPDLVSRIRNELDQLTELIKMYRPMIDRAGITHPANPERIALAGVLTLFYSGCDRMSRMILAARGGRYRNRAASDAGVLERMAMPAPGRNAVISRLLMELLHPYMSFRHYMNTTRSYRLSWEKMRPLVREVEEVLLLVDAELSGFLSEEVSPVPVYAAAMLRTAPTLSHAPA